MADFYVIPTNIGEAKMANALALGISLDISELAVGDGTGDGAQNTPLPNPEARSLISERRRAPINSFAPDPNNPNVLIAEQVIPEVVGGWWIRELGLFDADGDLIFVANAPPTYKPELTEGSGRTQVVRMAAIISNTAAVTLKVDPSVVIATRQYASQLLVEHKSAVNPHGQYVRSVQSLDDLQKEGGPSLEVGQQVCVAGVNFEWTGSKFRIRSDYMSPASYGASGDGATDDSFAIQACLDAIDAAGGGSCYIPAGQYLLNNTLEIGSNTKVFGDGPATHLFFEPNVNASSQKALLTNKGRNASGDRNISVYDLSTDVRLTEQGENYNLANITFCDVIDCHIYQVHAVGSIKHETDNMAEDPSQFLASAPVTFRRAQHCSVTDCRIEDGSYDNISFYEACHYNAISRNLCINAGDMWNKEEKDHGGAGIQITSFSGKAMSSNNVISENVVLDNTVARADGSRLEVSGIILHSSIRTTVANNQIRRVNGEGIRVLTHTNMAGESYDGIVITGNLIDTTYATIHPNSFYGITLIGSNEIEFTDTVIANNSMYNLHGGGIKAEQSVNNNITGNMVSNYDTEGQGYAGIELSTVANNQNVSCNSIVNPFVNAAPGINIQKNCVRLIITANLMRNTAGIADNSDDQLTLIIANNADW